MNIPCVLLWNPIEKQATENGCRCSRWLGQVLGPAADFAGAAAACPGRTWKMENPWLSLVTFVGSIGSTFGVFLGKFGDGHLLTCRWFGRVIYWFMMSAWCQRDWCRGNKPMVSCRCSLEPIRWWWYFLMIELWLEFAWWFDGDLLGDFVWW